MGTHAESNAISYVIGIKVRISWISFQVLSTYELSSEKVLTQFCRGTLVSSQAYLCIRKRMIGNVIAHQFVSQTGAFDSFLKTANGSFVAKNMWYYNYRGPDVKLY